MDTDAILNDWLYVNKFTVIKFGLVRYHKSLIITAFGTVIFFGSLMSTERGARLHTASHIRKELARIYRLAEKGKRDVQEVERLSRILGLMSRILEASDLEKRLEKLENAQNP